MEIIQKNQGTVPENWSDGPTGTTPDVIESVAAKYREYDMPGGWILPNDGYGCGYTDLPAVVAGLKKYGFRTGLWTENGVDKIAWEVGTAGTRAQKLDVAWTGKGYQFALDANHDAAQGILDNSDSRPFLWTVMGWAGIQRYAVTWTGDQSGSWDYIRWHISTLIGSGLSGQIYSTGDVDGIFGGSPETFTRDLQWKCFTPVLMGMSGWSKAARKHPWWFEEPYRSINRKYLKLKMRLMPYMYTYAWQAEKTGAPIIRGLMWDHPNDPHAYTEKYKNQFFLGKDLLIAPVFRSQSASKGWRKSIYLPEGTWIDYWDGRVTKAGKNGLEINYPVTLDKLPILVKSGAIIPMYPESLYDGQVAKDHIIFDIYPDGKSNFTLYEDDGNTRQYKEGAFSQQKIDVSAPIFSKSGDIDIHLAPVEGGYEGIELVRSYHLIIHSRILPKNIDLNGSKIIQKNTPVVEIKNTPAWFYNADEKYGTIHIYLPKSTTNQANKVHINIDPEESFVQTKPYPLMPDYGSTISPDSMTLLLRPFEESGHPFENVFDGNPDTWFRTTRDQSINTGPHEFVLYLGERKSMAGFDISPRNDKYWKYGQVKEYEIYMSDSNGDWGLPLHKGKLPLKQEKQEIRFEPIVGRLLRFRVLSTQDQNGSFQATNQRPVDEPFNAMIPQKVSPLTIGEFALHEHQVGDQKKLKAYLSDHPWVAIKHPLGKVGKNQAVGNVQSNNASVLKMNGLIFKKGLGIKGNSQIDFQLKGNWQLFRADVGIDDSNNNNGALNFQVWGDGRLLFDSGKIMAPAVVKPEIDIRSIKILSLRTIGDKNNTNGNWANAVVIGYEGDVIGENDK